MSQEQRKAFQELEEWIEDVVKGINPPTGKLNECSLSSEPVLPGKGGDYEYLTVQEGLSKATSTISDFFKSLTNTRQPVTFPEGRMTYCSCAYTNCGLPYGHIQHCFYELIADEDAPKVIYCEDRGNLIPQNRIPSHRSGRQRSERHPTRHEHLPHQWLQRG